MKPEPKLEDYLELLKEAVNERCECLEQLQTLEHSFKGKVPTKEEFDKKEGLLSSLKSTERSIIMVSELITFGKLNK